MVFYCNYCGKPWHVEDKCFTKKNDIMKKYFNLWIKNTQKEITFDLGGKSWADICDEEFDL